MYEIDWTNFRRPYTGQYPVGDCCPICGSLGDCPDAAPVAMPYPAFEIGDIADDRPGPLRLYAVTVNGFVTRMQLTDADAARYGDAAAPIL